MQVRLAESLDLQYHDRILLALVLVRGACLAHTMFRDQAEARHQAHFHQQTNRAHECVRTLL